MTDLLLIYIPNRTFLVHFARGISGELSQAMVHAKIPKARPSKSDMWPKNTKEVQLGICCYLAKKSGDRLILIS